MVQQEQQAVMEESDQAAYLVDSDVLEQPVEEGDQAVQALGWDVRQEVLGAGWALLLVGLGELEVEAQEGIDYVRLVPLRGALEKNIQNALVPKKIDH